MNIDKERLKIFVNGWHHGWPIDCKKSEEDEALKTVLGLIDSADKPKAASREWAERIVGIIRTEPHYTDAIDILLKELKAEFNIKEPK